MILSSGNVDHIPPVSYGEDLDQIPPEEIAGLLRKIAAESGYERIVVDMGHMGKGAVELFEACDVIYMPVLDDMVSMAKLEEFEEYLKEADDREDRSKIQKLRLPVSRMTAHRENYIEQLIWGEMGDFVRKLLEGGYERRNVLGQLKDQIYLEDEQLYDQIDAAIRQKGREVYLPLKERLWLRNSLYDSFRRLDILQELLDDKEVTEIMINGAGKIFIEKKGKMLLWNRRFEKTEQLEDIIQQIVGKVNRIVNVSSPIADARLEDGSRVHIVLPPVALDGPVVTIRKFPEPVTIEKLIRFQAITEEAAVFLEKLVEARYNIFVSGGTNSGKTTFLNALSSFIPEQERVITIEDSAELQIRHVPNLVRMETRNANTEGEGEITISQLIKASLRMNPSRIIVGEVRGGEALDMLQAIICTI